MEKRIKNVGIVGAGAWGTALAITANRAGNEAVLWAREPDVVAAINEQHENTSYLPGIELSSDLWATNDLAPMLEQNVLLLTVPAQYLRAVCDQLGLIELNGSIPLVICSKGLERQSGKLMSEVVREMLPNPLAVLSGPTLAAEVAAGFPASVTLACKDRVLGKQLTQAVTHPRFSIHYADDIIGPQICGAMKNVIAIACGIFEAEGLGESGKAALIVESLEEIQQLCVAKGGNPETVMELCGLGDLILTCNSRTSRNMSLGYALGRGETLEQILCRRRSVAEGVASSAAVTALARQLGICPRICEIVNRIVHGNVGVEKGVLELVQGTVHVTE